MLPIPGHFIVPDYFCPGRGTHTRDSGTVPGIPGQLVALHHRLIGNRIGDFLLVITKLFLLGVSAYIIVAIISVVIIIFITVILQQLIISAKWGTV